MSMSSSTSTDLTNRRVQHELAEFKREWWWFLLLGVLLILCGITALAYPFLSSVGVVIVLGSLLLVSGITILITSFWTGTWGAFLVQVLIAILYVVTGVVAMRDPVESTAVLTLLVAAMFIVGGVFRIVAAISHRFPQWGWVVLNGAISLFLGILILQQYPTTALWVIGTLFGVDLIINGWTWIMLSLEVRNIPVSEQAPDSPAP